MLTLTADHRAAAIALLLEQHKTPVIQAIVSACAAPLNLLEQTTIDMVTKRISIDAAEGVQLDAIGELLRLPRAGLVDSVYRLRLKKQIAIYKSSGRGDDLIAIATDVVAGFNVHLYEHEESPLEFEAYQRRISDGVVLPFDGGLEPGWTAAEADLVFDYLNRARPGAAYFVLINRDFTTTMSGKSPFRFDGFGGATFDVDYAWSLAVRSSQPIIPE